MLYTQILRDLPGRRLIRLCLFILPALFQPAWAAQSEAIPPAPQHFTGSPLPVTEAGAETAAGFAKVPGPVSGAGIKAENDRRDDLTGFFVIGMIINVLVITLFLIWAVGQWRKTKK